MKIQHGYGVNCQKYVKLYAVALVFLMMAILLGSVETRSESRGERWVSVACADSSADSELEYIYSEFSRLLPDGILDGDGAVGIPGIAEVFEYLTGAISLSGSAFASKLALLLGATVIFALAELLGSADSGVSETVKAGACICLSVPILNSALETISGVAAGMESGCEFFSGIIPLLCAVSAIGGGSTAAAASGASMSITLSIVSRVLTSNLLPLATFIFGATVIAAFDTGNGTQRVLKGVRTLFNFVMGGASAVMLATVGLQSVIASAKDTLAVRSAKYAIAGMIPAVGGTISATLSTLITGASVMMSVMGAASVAAISVIMGAPLVTLLLYRFAMQLCVSFAGLVGAGFAERFLESLRSALDCVLTVLCSTLIIFILEVVVFMKTGVPTA